MEWAGYHYGETIQVPAGTPTVGQPPRTTILLGDGSGLFVEFVKDEDLQAFLDRSVFGESRVLPMRIDQAGNYLRSLESVLESSRQEAIQGMPTVRTVYWCLRHLTQEGRGLESHFEHFKRLCGLNDDQWGMEEYANVVGFLKALLQQDQLDPVNVNGIELMFRRLQTIEYSYSDRLRSKTAGSGSRLTPEEQAAFGATARVETRLMICPLLMDAARVDLERESAVAKSLMKAREAREAFGKKKG